MKKIVYGLISLLAILTFGACGSDSHRDDFEPDRGLGKSNTFDYDDESEETNAEIPVTFSETNLVIGEIFTKDEILEYVNADSQNQVYAIKKGEDAFEILYMGYASAVGGDSGKSYDVVEFAHLHMLNTNWSDGNFAFTYSAPIAFSLGKGDQLVEFGAESSWLTKIDEVRYCVPLLFEGDLDGNFRLNENLSVNRYFYPYASCGEETKEDALEIRAIETVNAVEAWSSECLEVFDPDSKLIKYFLVGDEYNEVITIAGYAGTQYLEYSYWCNAYLYTFGETVALDVQKTQEGYFVILDGANCPDGVSVGDVYRGGMFTIEIVE